MMRSVASLKRALHFPEALAVFLAAAFFLVSCAGEGDDAKAPSEESGTGKVAAAGESAAAESVADVTFLTLDGEEKKISDFGVKILFVNYIETWNTDSKKLVPIMNRIQYKRQVNVKVIGIVTDRPASGVRTFARDNDVQFELLMPGGDPGRLGRPRKLPTTHVVTRERELFYTFTGLHTMKQYNDFISQMYRRRM